VREAVNPIAVEPDVAKARLYQQARPRTPRGSAANTCPKAQTRWGSWLSWWAPGEII